MERLHLTTPGVVKKKDQVMRNVTIPIKALSAERNGTNAPTASSRAVVSSIVPRRYASPRWPNMPSHETNGLFEIYTAMPSADCGVNFWMPKETKISTITQRRIDSGQYDPDPFSATLKC